MLRHNYLRNAQNMVATKETLSRKSYHTEEKTNVTTKNMLSQLKQKMSTKSSSRDRKMHTCNKNQNRNAVATRKAGSQHQFEEAAQHHCRNQENTIATEIQGRTQETCYDIQLLTAIETCNKIQNSITKELSSRD